MSVHNFKPMFFLYLLFLLNSFSVGSGVEIELEGTFYGESPYYNIREDIFNLSASADITRSKRHTMFDTIFHFDGKVTIKNPGNTKAFGFNTSLTLNDRQWSKLVQPSDPVESNRTKRNSRAEAIALYALVDLDLGHGEHQKFTMRTSLAVAFKSGEYTPQPKNGAVGRPKSSLKLTGKLYDNTPGGGELFNVELNLDKERSARKRQKREADEVKFRFEGQLEGSEVYSSGGSVANVFEVTGETTLAYVPSNIETALPLEEFEALPGRQKMWLEADGELSVAVNGVKKNMTLPISSQLFAHPQQKRDANNDEMEFTFDGNLNLRDGQMKPKSKGMSCQLKFWEISAT